MIVSRGLFESVLSDLKGHKTLSLDFETFGLRPYHGDRLFSLILGALNSEGTPEAYYFNFQGYDDLPLETVLGLDHLQSLKVLFSDPSKSWFIHKFNFDMHVLWAEGIELAGPVWCTMTQGRVEYNEHFNYDLASSLDRIGLKKDDKVEDCIIANGAWEWESIPGKKTRKKNKFFSRVPPEIIIPYGEDDAKGCLALGLHQIASIKKQALEYPTGKPTIWDAAMIEQRLAHTVFRMERVGVKIDREYCIRAAKYEADREEKARLAFERETKVKFSDHYMTLQKIFTEDRALWEMTKKGNPSFNSDALKLFKHPAARMVVDRRAAKSKLDFYNGFLYHADQDDVIHAQFHPGGTRTMRFSSSEPNLQNLTSEEATYCNACKEWYEQYVDVCPDCDGTDLKHPEFMVRRAIIPRPGFLFVMPDYDQMEYKLMLDYAKVMMIQHFRSRNLKWDDGYFEVANKVALGYDVHKATAELVGFTRKAAKSINFGLLYGEGKDSLAANLRVSVPEAMAMKAKYFRALPYVQFMVGEIMNAVRNRGWVRSWAGYKYNFPDRNFAYTGPNTVVQGGCAAVAKVAMNRIDEYFLPKKSRLVLSIHDEFPSEIHESEVVEAPRKIKELMESVYPYKYIPLTVGMEWSAKSLADKQKGFPV